MKRSNYFIPTLKENPHDAVIASHQLMLRAGLIRKTGSGLYSYLPYGLEILRKVENIVREEMNKSGALECKMPILIPKDYLLKSNRWKIFKNELFRLKDRKDDDYALSPTNEENFTSLVLEEIFSYKDLPINLYQINFKFRDEIRPRYGVMRGKEFLMKDAYSFHVDDKSLDETYKKMQQTYRNIFTRLGLDFISVEADSGAMGGSASEEFMVKSQVGEETIIYCENCSYAANLEKANELILQIENNAEVVPAYSKVFTPNTKTIKDVCAYLGEDIKKSIKARVYTYKNNSEDEPKKDELVLVLLRGDYEVNEIKLGNALGVDQVVLADEEKIVSNLKTVVGFIGGINLPNTSNSPNNDFQVFLDESLRGATHMVMGANEKDYHFKNVDVKRDLGDYPIKDLYLAKGEQRAGSHCPECRKDALNKLKGLEVGHIFKLGKKYSNDFSLKVKNESGKDITPTMGCYGIGVNRVLAAVIEQYHDEKGIILPEVISPFKVIILPVSVKSETQKNYSESLYNELTSMGLEVLLDDRKESLGFKFKDANLIGIPLQIVVGDKAVKEDKVEVILRQTQEKNIYPREEALKEVLNKKH